MKLKFLRPRGYGATRFATGCVADVPEPWASRFIADGTAEEVSGKSKEKDPPKADKKPKATKKGKGK
jgi:hypothetical protein